MTEITIGQVTEISEMGVVVDLQRSYWGDSAESVIPAHMLFSIAQYGGHVLVARDGARMVGMLAGMLGTGEADLPVKPENIGVFSKRMVVLPDYRGHGIATQLKQAQRDVAIRQGVQCVMWTFDPLLVANAHLNLRKLGAVGAKYVVNLYGDDADSGLAILGTSDRLKLNWWVTSERAASHAARTADLPTLDQYREAGARVVDSPAAVHLPDDGTGSALVKIPLNWLELVHRDPEHALVWRMQTRAVFSTSLDRGLLVTDFVRDADYGYYVLQREGLR